MVRYVDPQNKILYFPEHLRKWLAGEVIYPINVEVDLSNSCQLKCSMCNYANLRSAEWLSKSDIERVLTQLVTVGVRSVTWSGGGEPLTNPYAGYAFEMAWNLGLKQGIYTNGLLLDKHLQTVDRYCDWVHISLHAASPATYRAITGIDSFDKVVQNIKYLLKTRHRLVVGMGMVTIPENEHEILDFYQRSKVLGVNYCGFKPSCYISDPVVLQRMWNVVNGLPEDVVKTPYRYLDQMLEDPHPYKACHGHNFIGCVGAREDLPLWLCCSARGIEAQRLGSLKTQTFESIWYSPRRRDIIQNIDLSKCMRSCRPHALNKTLEMILAVNPHAEFL